MLTKVTIRNPRSRPAKCAPAGPASGCGAWIRPRQPRRYADDAIQSRQTARSSEARPARFRTGRAGQARLTRAGASPAPPRRSLPSRSRWKGRAPMRAAGQHLRRATALPPNSSDLTAARRPKSDGGDEHPEPQGAHRQGPAAGSSRSTSRPAAMAIEGRRQGGEDPPPCASVGPPEPAAAKRNTPAVTSDDHRGSAAPAAPTLVPPAAKEACSASISCGNAAERPDAGLKPGDEVVDHPFETRDDRGDVPGGRLFGALGHVPLRTRPSATRSGGRGQALL